MGRFRAEKPALHEAIVTDEDGVSAQLSNEATSALGRIMSRDSITVPKALEQAVLNENFLLDLEYSGCSLLLLQPNGQLKRVERVEAQT